MSLHELFLCFRILNHFLRFGFLLIGHPVYLKKGFVNSKQLSTCGKNLRMWSKHFTTELRIRG